MVKVILQIIVIVATVAIICIVQSSFKEYSEAVKFTEVKVNISDSSRIGFVRKVDILRKLNSFNLKAGVTKIKDINLQKIENSLKSDSYIKQVEVYGDINGRLVIDIKQFMPMLRIINEGGTSYFVDEEYNVVEHRNFVGMKLPIVSQEANVISIEDIKNKKEDKKSKDKLQKAKDRVSSIIRLLEFIEEDDIWGNMVSQVNLNRKGEVEIIPRLGNHVITFCDMDSVAMYRDYFDKLYRFYKSQSENGVWSQYSNVNLKYRGQVVCKKK